LSCRFVIVSVRFVMIEPGNLPPFNVGFILNGSIVGRAEYILRAARLEGYL
jgi:hypothetical protein